MTEDEKIAAEKAKAESEQKTERTFTQADMDLAMAKVRRDEKRKADAKIAEADMRGFARLLVTLAAGAVVLSGQARAAPASDPAPAQFTVNECPPGAGAAPVRCAPPRFELP